MRNKIAKILFVTFFFLTSAPQVFGAACGTIDLGGATIGVGNTDCLKATNGGVGGWGGLSNNYNLPGGSILGILQTTLMWLLGIFSVLGIIAFVVSGIKYLLAGANAELSKEAKTNMQWAILGIIVGLSGWIVLNAVGQWLSGANSKF